MAPKLTPADAQVAWTDPALAIDRRVRACTPAPGAWTLFRGDRLKLGPVTIAADVSLPPGQVQVTDSVLVGTATDAVRLGDVQPQGKKAMSAADWARGSRIDAEERLGQ